MQNLYVGNNKTKDAFFLKLCPRATRDEEGLETVETNCDNWKYWQVPVLIPKGKSVWWWGEYSSENIKPSSPDQQHVFAIKFETGEEVPPVLREQFEITNLKGQLFLNSLPGTLEKLTQDTRIYRGRTLSQALFSV